MKTIFHDTILNFGKYKGKGTLDVLAEDPGYFLWLSESGTYNLDDDVMKAVNTWAAHNGAEAHKVMKSAQKVRLERGDVDKTRDRMPAPASEPTIRDANWGSW